MNDNTNPREVVAATAIGVRALIPAQGTVLIACPTSLDLTTDQGRAWAINGCSPGDYECTPEHPLRMVVHHYLLIPDSSVDEETGEVSEFPRVVLYDREGKTFRSAGVAAPHQVVRMREVYPPECWMAGIPIVVTCRPSKRHRGSTYHDIRIDVEALIGGQ